MVIGGEGGGVGRLLIFMLGSVSGLGSICSRLLIRLEVMLGMLEEDNKINGNRER